MTMPPGPRGRQTLGFFGGGSSAGVVRFFERMARTYGPVSGFHLLRARIYLIDEPDLIADILVRRQHEFVRDTGATLLRELVGDGLLTSEEPRHRQRRRMLQPAFHRAQIATYARAMVDESAAVAARWAGQQAVDIAAEMRRLTLGVVGSALFGTDLGASAAGVADVLARVIRKGAVLAPLLALTEPLAQAYRRRWPAGPGIFGAERRELDAIVAPVIARRRADGGSDIISLLLAQRDESGAALSDDDIRNEAVTLVLAGHETTATALTWAWYLLARHPAAAKTMADEIDGAIGDRLPTIADIEALPYTSAVFNETLRLYPPAVAFGRRPIADITLGGYHIPRGSSVFVSPYVTQRDARWFAEPDAFLPERWAGPAPPKFAYFPFGGGAKMCIGESFSKLEGVLVLATLARRFQLELIGPQAVDIAAGAVLRPSRPIRMRPVARRRLPSATSSAPRLNGART